MNDIEILEGIIETYKRWNELPYKFNKDIIQALENILKERQEDKERIKELERQCDIYEKDAIHFKKLYQLVRGDDMIEKSLVREKIEEAKERIEDIKNQEYITCDEDEEMYILETKNAGWKELLEEGDDK